MVSRKRRWLRRLGIVVTMAALSSLTAWWTMIRMPGESYHGPLPAADTQLESLSEELHRDVEHLAVDIGERNVEKRPEALAKASAYITSEFRAAGYTVSRLIFMVGDVKCENIEVEVKGEVRPNEIVVVGAHYDTAHGAPGANDNTSGVAGVLALARQFAHQKPARTVRFVAFVNEEPPYFQTDKMGSRVYAQRCRQRGEKIVAMLAIEMIGYYSDVPGSQKYPPIFSMFYPSQGNFIGFVGNIDSGDLVRRAVGAFRANEQFPSEGAALPASMRGVGWSDQWSFWQEGYPAIMVTDTAIFRYPYYHQRADTIDKIDFDRAARVVRGLTKVLEEISDR